MATRARELASRRRPVPARLCSNPGPPRSPDDRNAEGKRLARHGRRDVRRVRRSAQREPDRARRRHAHPAPHRSDARLSLRVPRRHVRLMRDERQRHRALDLPHARGASVAKDGVLEIAPLCRICRSSATSSPTWRVLRQVGEGERAIQGHEDASRRFRADRAGIAGARRGRRRHRVHRLRRLLCGRATSSAGARRFSVPRRSIARGRSSTTRATARSASGMRAVAGDAGCHACHTQGSCGERCPKHIEPTAGIAGLKRLRRAAPRVRGEL